MIPSKSKTHSELLLRCITQVCIYECGNYERKVVVKSAGIYYLKSIGRYKKSYSTRNGGFDSKPEFFWFSSRHRSSRNSRSMCLLLVMENQTDIYIIMRKLQKQQLRKKKFNYQKPKIKKKKKTIERERENTEPGVFMCFTTLNVILQ